MCIIPSQVERTGPGILCQSSIYIKACKSSIYLVNVVANSFFPDSLRLSMLIIELRYFAELLVILDSFAASLSSSFTTVTPGTDNMSWSSMLPSFFLSVRFFWSPLSPRPPIVLWPGLAFRSEFDVIPRPLLAEPLYCASCRVLSIFC